MAEANKSRPDWKSRIKAEFERDKKRTVILLVLLVAAGIFGGRLAVKAIPGRAAAAPEANALLPDKNDAAGDGWKPGSLGASVSTALINGQVLRKGDWINGFQIKSIASDCCVIVRDGVELELRMGCSED